MKLYQCLLVQNRWYKSGNTIPKTGIVVHSSGANNPELRRYVNPAIRQTDGMGVILPEETRWDRFQALQAIGTNQYGNDWNRASQPYGMHAFVGKLANGTVAAVQTLPWDSFLWGCGSGSMGSYNASHIQFEICEDTTDREYTKAAYEAAVELCAHLCRAFDIPVSKIRSHRESYLDGYASAHVDPEHWWSLYGYTMDSFRAAVAKALGQPEQPDPVTVTVENAVRDAGINSPEYWKAVLRGEATASGDDIKALMDKYHEAVLRP